MTGGVGEEGLLEPSEKEHQLHYNPNTVTVSKAFPPTTNRDSSNTLRVNDAKKGGKERELSIPNWEQNMELKF